MYYFLLLFIFKVCFPSSQLDYDFLVGRAIHSVIHFIFSNYLLITRYMNILKEDKDIITHTNLVVKVTGRIFCTEKAF